MRIAAAVLFLIVRLFSALADRLTRGGSGTGDVRGLNEHLLRDVGLLYGRDARIRT